MTDLQKDLNWLEAYGQELIEQMSANGIEMSTMVALAQIDSAICAVRREMREESRPAVIDLSKLPDTPLAGAKIRIHLPVMDGKPYDEGLRSAAEPPAPAKECSFCEWLQEHEVGFPDYMVVHCPECKKQIQPAPAKGCEHKWKLREVDWGVEDWICDLCDKRVPYDPQPPETPE